jgi:Cu(I)/Ag(I) efflux system membrane fusion protein
MNMKKKLDSIGFVSLMFCMVVMFSCNRGQNEHDHSVDVSSEGSYVCPMRCEGDKTYSQPGTCPVCNMKLERLENNLIQTATPNKQVLSRQATIKLRQGKDKKTSTAQGYIVPAQDRNQSVASRFGGRLEKLYVKFNNQYVKKGDKIMDIYSPALANFQEDHLFLLNSKNENALLEKSRQRLRLLGITENQIAQLEKNGTVALTVSIYSPANGYVFFDGQSSATQVREGMYVEEGQTMFGVNDLKEVWALVSINNAYIDQIKANHSLEIVSESNPEKRLLGKVALTEQTFEEANQRFSRVRVVLPNENNLLKINSLVRAEVMLSGDGSSQVPSSAVYKTGLNAYVWVKTDTTQSGTGIFQLRKVLAGASNNGMTIVKSGLSPDEQIAREAGLMADSETFLSEK